VSQIASSARRCRGERRVTGRVYDRAIQVGDHELLLDDSRRLAESARKAGVDVQIDVFPEQQHTFQARSSDRGSPSRARHGRPDVARALIDRYISAFENADAAALERLLRADATLEATPFSTWFAGRKKCVEYLAVAGIDAFGDADLVTRFPHAALRN
jgi:alpha/beta hydrolase fold